MGIPLGTSSMGEAFSNLMQYGGVIELDEVHFHLVRMGPTFDSFTYA